MRKTIKITIIVTTLFAISFLCFKVYNKIQTKNVAEKNTATLPIFSFKTITGAQFTSNKLVNEKGTVIVNYFNPGCEHCQYMVQTFVQNADNIQNIKILMITIADSISVTKFSKDYGLDKLSNITLLLDKDFQFDKIFSTNTVPSFFVYKDGLLQKKVIGEAKLSYLLSK